MESTRIQLRKDVVSEIFGTDIFTTNRIVNNFCWGFFIDFFGEDAQKMWDASRPFYCTNPDCLELRDYSYIDLKFLVEHFELFASNQFYINSGWSNTINETTRRVDWIVETGYYQVQPMYIDSKNIPSFS